MGWGRASLLPKTWYSHRFSHCCDPIPEKKQPRGRESMYLDSQLIYAHTPLCMPEPLEVTPHSSHSGNTTQESWERDMTVSSVHLTPLDLLVMSRSVKRVGEKSLNNYVSPESHAVTQVGKDSFDAARDRSVWKRTPWHSGCCHSAHSFWFFSFCLHSGCFKAQYLPFKMTLSVLYTLYFSIGFWHFDFYFLVILCFAISSLVAFMFCLLLSVKWLGICHTDSGFDSSNYQMRFLRNLTWAYGFFISSYETTTTLEGFCETWDIWKYPYCILLLFYFLPSSTKKWIYNKNSEWGSQASEYLQTSAFVVNNSG